MSKLSHLPDLITQKKTERPDYAKVKWPHNDTEGGLFGLYYKHQNPPLSECVNKRYVVYQFAKRNGAGNTKNLGAIYMGAILWLAWCNAHDYIFVLDDREWFLAAECEIKTSECYFKPVSTCTIDHALARAGNDHYIIKSVEVVDKSKDVIFLPPEINGWPPTYGFAQHIKPFWSHQCHLIGAGLLYLWRPQPWLVDVLEDNMRAALPDWFDPQTTIGMPVRASDKCKGHTLEGSARGELTCETIEHLLSYAQKMRKQFPEVDTLIFTSEDPKFVSGFQKLNEQQPDGQKFKLVLNVRDVMQGTGSAIAVTKTTKEVTSYKKVMESALTSFHMQLRARYLLMRYTTSWNLAIKLALDSDLTAFAKDRHVYGYGEPSRFHNFRC